jgi:hypothetical protein
VPRTVMRGGMAALRFCDQIGLLNQMRLKQPH